MATQLRHDVADDPRRWNELLPTLTTAYNIQPHRSTGIVPFKFFIARLIPSFLVRNLRPGTLLKNKGTLNDGSPLARKREFMAKLIQKSTAVVEALQRPNNAVSVTATRKWIHETNVFASVPTSIRIATHKRTSCKAGPSARFSYSTQTDDSTYVVDVNGDERRVNSDHVTPAPRPPAPEEPSYPFLDRLDKPESTPPVPEKYVIDRLLGIRRTDVI